MSVAAEAEAEAMRGIEVDIVIAAEADTAIDATVDLVGVQAG